MPTIGSFRQARCSWSRTIPCSSSNIRDLVKNDSKNVEDHIVDDERNPWPDCDTSKNKLSKRISKICELLESAETYKETYKPCFDEGETRWEYGEPRHSGSWSSNIVVSDCAR